MIASNLSQDDLAVIYVALSRLKRRTEGSYRLNHGLSADFFHDKFTPVAIANFPKAR